MSTQTDNHPAPFRCGLRPGTPHEPHGSCLGTAPEFMSERVLTSAEADCATGPAAELAAIAHGFVRPGQVAPDRPAPDECVRCGWPEAGHRPADPPPFSRDLSGDLLAISPNRISVPDDQPAAELDPEPDLEPYCEACGEWIGLFSGLEGWQHFRGDGAPGGQRELYDADHPAEVVWTVPVGRKLSPAALALLWAALKDATEYRRASVGNCPDCESHPAGLCEPHADELDQADLFAALAKRLEADL